MPELGVVLSELAWLYQTLRMLGALYPVYLGVRLLLSAYRHDGVARGRRNRCKAA